MATILVTDDLSATQAKVVRMICAQCNWQDKTYAIGSHQVMVAHLTQKHGGNGQMAYHGQFRKVINGRLEEVTNDVA